ncbi:MAG: glycosyltransferase family 4 protein [Gemmatimonadaceae bacterium]
MLSGPLVVFGTYDPQKQRARILLEGLRQLGVTLHEVNVPTWAGVRDKGTLTAREKFGAGLRMLAAFPQLVVRYLRAPSHTMVLVPYPGVFEVLLLLPFAAARGAAITWDLFISPWDTLVNDRRTQSAAHPVSLLLYACEWIAARAVAHLFLDTQAHARRFERLMGLEPGRVGAAPLGTDPNRFPRRTRQRSAEGPLRLLFYGQFIPLHGLETIIRAAALLEERGVRVDWRLVGAGQEEPRVAALIAQLGVRTVTRLGWVPAEELPALIYDCDYGLGIFGVSDKALTVVPNKVYELAATQTPIITGNTPAMREFAPGHPMIHLVPPGDPAALADCVERLGKARQSLAVPSSSPTLPPQPPSPPPLPVIGPREVAAAALRVMGVAAEHPLVGAA